MTGRWQFWRGWSIGLRMAFITMLPVAFLFTSFLWYSWYAHRAQVFVDTVREIALDKGQEI